MLPVDMEFASLTCFLDCRLSMHYNRHSTRNFGYAMAHGQGLRITWKNSRIYTPELLYWCLPQTPPYALHWPWLRRKVGTPRQRVSSIKQRFNYVSPPSVNHSSWVPASRLFVPLTLFTFCLYGCIVPGHIETIVRFANFERRTCPDDLSAA